MGEASRHTASECEQQHVNMYYEYRCESYYELIGAHGSAEAQWRSRFTGQ